MGKVNKKAEEIRTRNKNIENTFVVVEYSDLVSYCHISEAGDLPILFEAYSEEEAKEIQRIKAEELGKKYQY
jgi:hypothetical protein